MTPEAQAKVDKAQAAHAVWQNAMTRGLPTRNRLQKEYLDLWFEALDEMKLLDAVIEEYSKENA